MMITETQAHRIAAAIHAIRDDWDPQGIMSALAKVKDRDPATTLIAFTRAARNPDIRTPAVAAMAGDHWHDPTPSTAAKHPSAVRIGDLCATHGTHRDTCGCDPKADAARRHNATERNAHWAAIARKTLHDAKDTP